MGLLRLYIGTERGNLEQYFIDEYALLLILLTA